MFSTISLLSRKDIYRVVFQNHDDSTDIEMLIRREHSDQLRLMLITFLLYQKSAAQDEITETLVELDEEENEFRGIRCPLCDWQPTATSLWLCGNRGHPEYFFGGCGTTWNTFTTRGLCPGCAHQWRYTACLRCWGWALHEDWYVGDNH